MAQSFVYDYRFCVGIPNLCLFWDFLKIVVVMGIIITTIII